VTPDELTFARSFDRLLQLMSNDKSTLGVTNSALKETHAAGFLGVGALAGVGASSLFLEARPRVGGAFCDLTVDVTY
jgi:hypothetical protein